MKKFIKKIIKYFSNNKFVTLNCVEISKSALLYNFSFFQKINPNSGIIPVLKSNAYGHGIVQCAEILNGADCDFLAVDGYYEAVKISDITNHKILVLGYIRPENYKLLDCKKCSYVVQDIESLEAFGNLNKNVNIHIELNTGMNRLGLGANELIEYLHVLKKYPKLKLEGVMTHLADADNDNDILFTEKQVKRFDAQIEKIKSLGFSPKYIHIAQTAGCLIANSKYANAVRIGIGLYGINPLSKANGKSRTLDELKPVLELKSTIIKSIELKVGDKVSYNGIFTAEKPMRIGVLPIGYYEGVPRELSNRGFVTVGEDKFQVIGRVCMNHTMIDLSDSKFQVGDEVTVISNKSGQINSIARICDEVKLFNYQLMSNITENIRRIIVE